MKSLKVALITSMFPTEKNSSRGQFVYDSLKAYPEDVSVSLFILEGSKDTPLDFERVKLQAPCIKEISVIRYRPLPRILLPISTLVAILKTVAACKQRTFDLLHAHFLWPAGAVASFLSRRSGTPAICTCHGSDVNVLAKRWYMKPSLVNTLSHLDGLVLVSEALKRELEQNDRLPSHIKLCVIHNGCARPTSYPRENVLERLGLTTVCDRKRILLFVGNLVDVKRPLVLLQAFSQVRRQVKGLVLLMVGDGPLRERVGTALVDLGLNSCVHLLGTLPNNLVLELMRSSELLLLCSKSEGLPVVVVEALSQGLPVVSTAVGGVTEVLHKGNGVIVEGLGLDDFSSGICRGLAKDWDRDQIREESRGFSWERVVLDTLAFYESILADNRGR